MNNVIRASEVIKGNSYRLFPNGKRSRYLLVKCLDVQNGHAIFICTYPIRKFKKVISNVDILENVQAVSKNG